MSNNNMNNFTVLNNWFSTLAYRYIKNYKNFKSDFNQLISNNSPELLGIKITNLKYLNVLVNMFQSARSQFPDTYKNFNDFELWFNSNCSMKQDYYINFDSLNVQFKAQLIRYINNLIYVTNFIIWKNNCNLVYQIVTKMSEGCKSNYIWNGKKNYEILTSKLTKYIHNDFVDYILGLEENWSTPLTESMLNENNILDKTLDTKYRIIKKNTLIISPNSAFTQWTLFNHKPSDKNTKNLNN